MKILYTVGARPNFVKMAPVLAALRRRIPDAGHVLVDTGQHYDPIMSAIFRDELDLPQPDHVLGVGSGSHAVQTARVMERIEPILAEVRPDLIIVPGDVNSTIAVSLVAAKLEIKIAHLEAGLRSFDRSMPEEINRVLTDQLSEILLIHSAEAADNLAREGIAPERIHFVGNTMIDSLVSMRRQFGELQACRRFGLRRGEYVLVTLHRPALVDGPLLAEVMDELNRLSLWCPVVFPAHPRTRKMIQTAGTSPQLRLVEPVGYLEFLSLQADARAVLTDSGGVQEETTFLGVPCFTLRANTERPVTITSGTNRLLGLNPSAIGSIAGALNRPAATLPAPPGWDGRAAERVADVVSAQLQERARNPSERTTVP